MYIIYTQPLHYAPGGPTPPCVFAPYFAYELCLLLSQLSHFIHF